MKQDQFIEQKKASWQELSELIKSVEKKGLKNFDKEKILKFGRLYRQTSSDLSYSKIKFKNSQTSNYLNQLVARAHSQIYLPEPFSTKSFMNFYRQKFPDSFRQSFSHILLASLIFILSACISFVTVKCVPSTSILFAPKEIILPIEEGLRKNQMGAKFPEGIGPMLSSEIMTNNISVGFKAFAFGITFGAGTVYVLIFNGFMLGSLAAVASNYNYNIEFWSLILPHGITELLAIFICGGAGLLIADAILNPGDLRRVDALKINGNRAIKLIMGVIPLFIIAGIIEGFITPMKISPVIKLIFSLITGILLIIYFLAGQKFKIKKKVNILIPCNSGNVQAMKRERPLSIFFAKIKKPGYMSKRIKIEDKKSYGPEGRYLWDSWILKDEFKGQTIYRLFHLDAPDNGNPESRHKNAVIRQAVSTDMKSWQDVGAAIKTGAPGAWDEGFAMWTGNVYKKENGEYVFFYTASDPNDKMLYQRVGLARSKDGENWKKDDKPFLEPDGKYYETTEKESPIVRAWRDPSVVKDDETGKYNMYITAKTKDGDPTYRGCIALAVSDEIDGKYETQPPVLAPGLYAQMEVPQIIKRNGKVYLFFSSMEKDYNPEWAEKIGGPQTGLHCFVGNSLKGPFEALNGTGIVTKSIDNLYTVKLM